MNLIPSTSYIIKLAAKTSIGTGPATSDINVTTLSSGKIINYRTEEIEFFNSMFNFVKKQPS